MSKNDTPPTSLPEAQQKLLHLLEPEILPSNKQHLGKIQTTLDLLPSLMPTPCAPLADIVTSLDAHMTLILLDEATDPAEAVETYLQAVSTLTADLLNEETLETTCNSIMATFSSADESEADTTISPDAEKEEAPQELDPLTLQGEEDWIIYREFLGESYEHLEIIENQVLELEQNPGDLEVLNQIFRCFHSMKGAAGFLGQSTINHLCHEAETLLDRARKQSLVIDQTAIDVILASIDCAKRLIHALNLHLEFKKGKLDSPPEPVDTRQVLRAIRAILERPPQPSVRADMLTETQPDPARLGGRLVADGAISVDDLSQALSTQKKPVGEILVDMGKVSSQKVQETLGELGADKKGAQLSAAIKVETERLDRLMEMVGELAISGSQVAAESQHLNGTHQKLTKQITEMSKTIKNLQELVMTIRMIPLRQTFQKMARLVRDTSKKTGKKARLHLSGEDTEIDKTIIDRLADPLVHLLRNAVDHGVEAPETRAAQGKNEEGNIHLSAYHQSGKVMIEITDDGKGLDREKLLKKAIEKKLADTETTYTDKEVFDFIFLPGFSTHDNVTDISGRGVGMDVVRNNITLLGGQVEVLSQKNAGTTFRIALPLTMALVDGMLAQVGAQRLIIPVLSMEESLHASPDQISSVRGNAEVVCIRNELIPIIHLHKLLDIPDAVETPTQSVLVILNHDSRRCALMVDQLLQQQQVVVKSLGPRLQNIKGLAGATILGDGTVGLILDIAGIYQAVDTAKTEDQVLSEEFA